MHLRVVLLVICTSRKMKKTPIFAQVKGGQAEERGASRSGRPIFRGEEPAT